MEAAAVPSDLDLGKIKNSRSSSDLKTLVVLDRVIGAEYKKPELSELEIALMTSETENAISSFEEELKSEFMNFALFYVENITSQISVRNK